MHVSQLMNRIAGCCLLGLALTGPATGSVIYDEAVNGDFSNNRALPTILGFNAGTNDVFGTTGRSAAGTDLDYFTFTIPVGETLTSLTVIKSVLSAGGAAFIGLESGDQITVDPAAATAAPLLGYKHFAPADVGVDILPAMGASAGAIDFVAPLGAGQYSVWIQDTNLGASVYGLRFEVPEPGTALLSVAALAGMALARRRTVRVRASAGLHAP